MNATQKTLMAIGVVVLLAAGTFGYLVWDAWSEKTAAEEELDSSVSTAEGLMRSPVRLDDASVRALGSNATAYVTWRTNALTVAGCGDLLFAPVSNGQLKEQMRAQAAKFAALPGGAEGHFVKSDFGFGFKPYVTDGQLPPANDVPRLQREWNDVTHVVGILAACGASEITEIAVRAEAADDAKAQQEKKGAKKSVKKGKKKGADDDGERAPSVTRLAVDFLTPPSGFGAALSALATNTVRFVTVEDFRFTRESDALAEAVGTEKKPEAAAKPVASRRRRALAAAKKDEKRDASEEKKTGLAFDPETAPRIRAHLELSVRDFNTRVPAAADDAKEEGK